MGRFWRDIGEALTEAFALQEARDRGRLFLADLR
jgi:hypothetical protein